MHRGDFIASLLGYFWPSPTRRTADDTSSRLSDRVGWGLFAISLVAVLLVGFAFLIRLLGTWCLASRNVRCWAHRAVHGIDRNGRSRRGNRTTPKLGRQPPTRC